MFLPRWWASSGWRADTPLLSRVQRNPPDPHVSAGDPRDVGTTMIHTHVLSRGPAGVRSPADRMFLS